MLLDNEYNRGTYVSTEHREMSMKTGLRTKLAKRKLNENNLYLSTLMTISGIRRETGTNEAITNSWRIIEHLNN